MFDPVLQDREDGKEREAEGFKKKKKGTSGGELLSLEMQKMGK